MSTIPPECFELVPLEQALSRSSPYCELPAIAALQDALASPVVIVPTLPYYDATDQKRALKIARGALQALRAPAP